MSLQEPLRFAPKAVQKVWGGNRLVDLFPGALSVTERVGEVWQVYDRPGDSSSVAEGALAGRSLNGLMLSEREALLGESRPSADGGFPLLVKYLDTREALSVQVHPDEAAAARLGAQPKDECWYVLEADPESVVYLGLRADVGAATFAEECNGPEVVHMLESHTVRPGQFIEVPAGTIHSIGGGLTLVEIQQSSESSFRIYDWGRVDMDGRHRELHRDEALQSIDYEGSASGPVVPELLNPNDVNGMAQLVRRPSFSVDYLKVHENLDHETQGRAWVYVVLSGSGTLAVPSRDEHRISAGETWVLPADIGAYSLSDSDGELQVLRVEAHS